MMHVITVARLTIATPVIERLTKTRTEPALAKQFFYVLANNR